MWKILRDKKDPSDNIPLVITETPEDFNYNIISKQKPPYKLEQHGSNTFPGSINNTSGSVSTTQDNNEDNNNSKSVLESKPHQQSQVESGSKLSVWLSKLSFKRSKKDRVRGMCQYYFPLRLSEY